MYRPILSCSTPFAAACDRMYAVVSFRFAELLPCYGAARGVVSACLALHANGIHGSAVYRTGNASFNKRRRQLESPSAFSCASQKRCHETVKIDIGPERAGSPRCGTDCGLSLLLVLTYLYVSLR